MTKKKPQPRNHAVTLIELTVSLAIVAMLMVAAMSIIRGVSRAEAQASRRHEQSWAEAPLRELLVCDLRNAQSYTPAVGGGQLWTMVSFQPGTMELHHLPVVVQYQVRRIASVNWLVRVQRAMTPGQDMAELVCSGVKTFGIQTKGPTGAPGFFAATVEFDTPGRKTLQCVVPKD